MINVEDLKSQLEELKSNAFLLIDLRKKIYVFLEPPHPDLWAIIKPIMSHDSFVMEHPYVDSNTRDGIHVKTIITLGWIESIDVRNGNTKKAYYPIVVPSETSGLNVKSNTRETSETKIFPQFFTFHKINVPRNFELRSKDWLIYQILGLWKCGIELGGAQYSIDNYNEAIQFLDIESKLGSTRNKITLRQFSQKYDASETLSRHFSKPIFGDYYNKIFGKIQYIGVHRSGSTVISGSDVSSSLSSV